MSATALDRARQASAQRVQAWVDDDLDGMAVWLDEALLYVHSTGQMHDKAQLLAFLGGGLRALDVEREPLAAYGGDALVCLTFMQHLRGQLRQAPQTQIQARSCFTEVWRRVGDDWRLLHAQSTALAATVD